MQQHVGKYVVILAVNELVQMAKPRAAATQELLACSTKTVVSPSSRMFIFLQGRRTTRAEGL